MVFWFENNEPSVDQSATGSPVELEVTVVGTRNGCSVHGEGLVSCLSRGKLHEAVTSVAERVSTTSS